MSTIANSIKGAFSTGSTRAAAGLKTGLKKSADAVGKLQGYTVKTLHSFSHSIQSSPRVAGLSVTAGAVSIFALAHLLIYGIDRLILNKFIKPKTFAPRVIKAVVLSGIMGMIEFAGLIGFTRLVGYKLNKIALIAITTSAIAVELLLQCIQNRHVLKAALGKRNSKLTEESEKEVDKKEETKAETKEETCSPKPGQKRPVPTKSKSDLLSASNSSYHSSFDPEEEDFDGEKTLDTSGPGLTKKDLDGIYQKLTSEKLELDLANQTLAKINRTLERFPDDGIFNPDSVENSTKQERKKLLEAEKNAKEAQEKAQRLLAQKKAEEAKRNQQEAMKKSLQQKEEVKPSPSDDSQKKSRVQRRREERLAEKNSKKKTKTSPSPSGGKAEGSTGSKGGKRVGQGKN